MSTKLSRWEGGGANDLETFWCGSTIDSSSLNPPLENRQMEGLKTRLIVGYGLSCLVFYNLPYLSPCFSAACARRSPSRPKIGLCCIVSVFFLRDAIYCR